MKKNRLQLDFSIETATERNRFINTYIENEQFKIQPLTNEELDTIAKYLLYGKDEDGESCISRGEVQVDTKNKTWAQNHKVQSLEYLLNREEGPSLDENQILKPYQAHYKNIREVFSREEALQKAPDLLKPIFSELFNRIDKTELLLNFYELAIGKRTKPPRDGLVESLTEEEILELKEKAKDLTQYQYLKKKHELVELRREQYTLRDSYNTSITRDSANAGAPLEELSVLTFDYDIAVYPLGLKTAQSLIFRPFNELNPFIFNENQLKKISSLYWEKQKPRAATYFDFCDMECVYNLFLQYFELKNSYLNDNVDSTTNQLFDTLQYYIGQAGLSDVQQEILSLKIKHWKNQDIANQINKKYQKTYTANYISTIFRQKIIKKINEAALFHQKIVGSLFFEEEFKPCTKCGVIKLICAENFTRKSRSKDGFTNRCKKCEHELRQGKI